MFLTLASNIFQAIAPLLYILLLAVLFFARIEFKTVPSNIVVYCDLCLPSRLVSIAFTFVHEVQ